MTEEGLEEKARQMGTLGQVSGAWKAWKASSLGKRRPAREGRFLSSAWRVAIWKRTGVFCVASEGRSRQMGDIVRTQIPIQNRGEFLTSSAAWHDAERLSSWLSQLRG